MSVIDVDRWPVFLIIQYLSIFSPDYKIILYDSRFMSTGENQTFSKKFANLEVILGEYKFSQNVKSW